MPNILASNIYKGLPLDILYDELPNGFELIMIEESSQESLNEKAAFADYLLAGGRLQINEDFLSRARNLKMIQRSGVGLDSLNLGAIRSRNIPVYVNAGVNSVSVAEHTVMLMLAALKNLLKADRSVKSGIWSKHELGMQSRELFNKTVGLIGMGHIGTKVAEMLQGFNVRLLYTDIRQLSTDVECKLNLEYVSKEVLLTESDIISLHCPLTTATEKIISDKDLSLMKEDTVLINTSRGQLIDESSLFSSLKSQRIKAAGLDVLLKEPVEKDNKLLKLDNVLLTPHFGGVTQDAFRRMMKLAFRNIQIFDNEKYAEIEDNKLLL